MRYSTLILFCLISIHGQAQLFGKQDICIQQGIINFHASVLNNKNNTNSKLSWVNEVDKNLLLGGYVSVNVGLGLGNIRNPENTFKPYETVNFFRTKFGFVFHTPQKYTAKNWSPKRVNPFIKTIYNLDIMDQRFGEINTSRLSTSLKLGIGVVYRVSHSIGILYEFSHNQYVTPDYRTYFQNNIGIIINLDTPYKAY